jgi:hypothetical protein
MIHSLRFEQCLSQPGHLLPRIHRAVPVLQRQDVPRLVNGSGSLSFLRQRKKNLDSLEHRVVTDHGQVRQREQTPSLRDSMNGKKLLPIFTVTPCIPWQCSYVQWRPCIPWKGSYSNAPVSCQGRRVVGKSIVILLQSRPCIPWQRSYSHAPLPLATQLPGVTPLYPMLNQMWLQCYLHTAITVCM